MAFENLVHPIPGLVAAGDLSTKQHYIIAKNTTAQQVDVCGDGAKPIGVLTNKPSAAGMAANVAGVGSVVKVVCGGTVTAGDSVASDANGKAVTAGGSDYILGTAIVGAGSDELATVYIHNVGHV